MLAHSHKPAGPEAQMSLAGAGAMQQPARGQPPPLAASSNARLSNPSEPPVSYYSQQQPPPPHQAQNHHYQADQHPNEMAPHPGPMIARRTGPPQGQVLYAAQTNGNQLSYPQQQQQPMQQPIPVRHNQQQQQLVSESNAMQQLQHQRGYARPEAGQAHANFNPSVNTTNQAQGQQVQQPHQQQQPPPPLMGGPSGDLMAPGGDSFAQSSAPLLQQQLNRQRPTSQLSHEPASYQLDGLIQQQPQHHHHQQQQQQQQHANFAYQPQQAARPMPGHKQRPPQQRQQVSASAQLQQQQLDVQPQQFPCNPTPPLTPNRLAGGPPPHQHQQQHQQHPQHLQDEWSLGQPQAQQQQQQPVNSIAGYHQEAQPAPPLHQLKQRIHQMPKSQPPPPHSAPNNNSIHYHPTGQAGQFIAQPLEPQVAPLLGHKPAPAGPPMGAAEQQIRLTLPLRDGALLGPFKLEHDVQFVTKSFHLRPQLFEQLSKAAMQQHHQAAAVIQELQFRAYLSAEVASQASGNSLLAGNHPDHHQQQHRTAHTNSCQWPEMFQVSCNQQLVHLNRSQAVAGGRVAHRAVDLFPYCQPGDNLLELQVHGCYCSHEFVLELVDRPTLKAFMNSCFKTRLLSSEACLAKLASWFGKPGFSCQLPAAGIINEYVTEYLIQPNGQQVEQTRLKISLRCPLSGRRMRTPTRGPNCTHLQCFDLESFLLSNRERTRWSCPICALPVPFNMLELDQHQIGICQSMASVARTDEVLVNNLGQWQCYQAGSPPPPLQQAPMYKQHQPSAIANGAPTFQPQPTGAMPLRPAARGAGPPTHWDQQQQQQLLQQSASPPTSGPVRRPPSSMGGAHQSASKAKRPPPNGNANSNTPPYQSPGPLPQAFAPQHQSNFLLETTPAISQTQAPDAELSPLAAMERTIIHHEQQMGPPPFDANILTASSSPLRSGGAQPAIGAGAHSSSSSTSNAAPPFGSPHHHQPSPPDSIQLMSQQQQAVASPLRQVPASPQQQQTRLPQSPLHQTGASQVQQSSSTPATPLLHAAPDTPATPGQPGNMQPQSAMQQQLVQQQQQQQNVDHQPLSNGSASAASITSTSTLTPSGQSLGSVGMGGDSRCNTAPLQNALGSLDDLVQVANPSGQLMNSSSPFSSSSNNKRQMAPMHQQQLQHQQFDGSLAHSSGPFEGNLSNSEQADKSDILMSKLMMEAAGEGGQPSELALALEEAEWKQQLDRGKSEHLANFLNEPLMNKKPLHQHQNHHFAGPASQQHQLLENSGELEGANKMLSGLNPSDDEGLNQLSPARGFGAMGSPSSDLLAEQLDQQHQHSLDSYANYLDSNVGDDGAGLPPDDSILDLFER